MKKEAMKTLSFRVPVSFYEIIAAYCEEKGMTHSEFLRMVIRNFIQA